MKLLINFFSPFNPYPELSDFFSPFLICSASKAAAEVDHPDLITAQRVRCYPAIPMVTTTIRGMT